MFLRAALISAFCLLSGPALANSCVLTFTIEVTQGIGPYPPGSEITGEAEFTTFRSIRQEGGATAHLTQGEMRLNGEIIGTLWTLITTSRVVAADLIGIYARDVEGLSFAGQDFDGPMAITLYGDPGTWPSSDPPSTQEEWDSLTLRRTFQLHAHGQDMLSGDITDLQAECT